MEIIGLIAEYNPFHHGHLYQIKKIKKLYPDSLIILILNGYFLERGNISIESKEYKTSIALKYGIDLVIELPFIFGTNSADIFASSSIYLLNKLNVNRIIFGSESNNIKLLEECAKYQLEDNFDKNIKLYLDQGYNYPTALAKASKTNINTPNDLLGISYIKTILKNNYKIKYETIKRTNDYHDLLSNNKIISASNIRNKISNNINIDKYVPEYKINNVNNLLLFNILKYKINTEKDLSIYLDVDEGIENRLLKNINKCNTLDEFVGKIKTKRYTYNKINRMFIHILVGLTKEDKNNLINPEYIRLLGFNEKGSKYLNKIKKNMDIPIITRMTNINNITKNYELKAAVLYSLITNDNVLEFEEKNKPIKI